MKLTTLFENKDKKPNPMAKVLSDPKYKPKTETDKKKESKKGYQKHKGKVEEAGYQGEIESTHHDFKNVDLDSIKKLIADKQIRADVTQVANDTVRVHTYDADRKSVATALEINEDPETDYEGSMDYELSGDDGELAYGTIHYKAINGVVDPNSLDGSYEYDGNHKIDDTIADEMIKVGGEEHEEALKAAQEDYDYEVGRMKSKFEAGGGLGSMDMELAQVQGILRTHQAEWNMAKQRGEIDLDGKLRDALYSYYMDSGEMPYGTQKARDGDPDEWVHSRLDDLGLWESSTQTESTIKPYVSMYKGEDGKMVYDVLDKHSKSAFKSKDKEEAFTYFKNNFDNLKEYDGPDETKDNAGFTDKQIRMAFGVLNDPKFKGGNYSGAVTVINKIAPALADHPSVANALKRANEDATQPTQDTAPQKGPDDSRLQTNVSLQQVANLFPGIENKQVFLQSLLRLKQGQKISMQHAYTLADAFKELLSKNPQDTQRTMIQLKKISATEDKEYGLSGDDAPGYPYQNKTMNQGKTPFQALKDEKTDDSMELDRVKRLAGLLRATED